MKPTIKQMVRHAAKKAYEAGVLPVAHFPDMEIETPRHDNQGDLSTNFAMVSASVQKMAPRKIADILVAAMDPAEGIEKIEVAGPGFINFFLYPHAWHPVITTIFEQDQDYGASEFGRGKKVQVEFVSANPTGPLHVGHGRGAAVGDALGNILSFAGFSVSKEYYINDSGRQIRTLGQSVWSRLQELARRPAPFPEGCYQGEYIKTLARDILDREGLGFADREEAGAIEWCARYAAEKILSGIKADLSAFNVSYDHWFSEQSLYDSGRVAAAIDSLKARDLVYEKEGALWFRSSDFGDEKDRVVVRNNGLTTYFASDIAYHQEKFERGFDRVIDVWGADHHGYIPRMSASVAASGQSRDQFQVVLVQLVNLVRDGKPVQMSTRAGEFVTLRDILDEVGTDAARFMFLSRSYDSGLDFDLAVAKQKSSDNPVYYVQYVHARITGIFRKAREKDPGLSVRVPERGELSCLTAKGEVDLIKILAGFPGQVEKSAATCHPHVMFTYLMSLASAFHTYYNRHKVITDDPALTRARLCLVLAVQKVIRNGLTLLGVSAPERM